LFFNVTELSASYDKNNFVIKDVSFGLQEGELACLLGPSGCGKTTILRAISGFQRVSSGHIALDGMTLSDPNTFVSPELRNVGMVFQDHALFPHLSIADNVGFGLPGLAGNDRTERVEHLLKLVSMQDFSERYPHELSGGQSQRVALARAIAPRPKLLLMDEPFSNLDTELRESLGHEIRALLKELGITAIMVTHDQHDAFALGDQIGIMSQGHLIQWGSSYDLYHAPTNRFVANFIGDGTFVTGQLVDNTTVVTNFGEIRGERVSQEPLTHTVDLLIRPDDVKLGTGGQIQGTISRKVFKGAQTLYTVSIETGESLLSLMPSHNDYEVGDTIDVSIDADHLVCFDAEKGVVERRS